MNSDLLSIWQRRTALHVCDTAVIGAGVVGLSAAIELKRRDPALRVSVLERGPGPFGASVRNAGFACFGSPSELLADIDAEGEEAAVFRVERRWKGLLALRKELGDDAIGTERKGGHELFIDKDLYTRSQDRLNDLNAALRPILGEDAYHLSRLPPPSTCGGAILGTISIPHECSLDTGRLMHALMTRARELGIEVLTGAHVRALEDTGQGVLLDLKEGQRIRADRLIVATNGYCSELLPELGIRPARGQVLLTAPLPDMPWKGTYHCQEGFYYFRDLDGALLLGGARHLAIEEETTTEHGISPIIMDALEDFLRTYLLPPGRTFQIAHRWSGIMGFGPDKEPIVRRVSERVVAAVGLGGMGVAIGTTVGREAASLLMERLPT